MKKLFVTGLFIATTFFVSAQKTESIINTKEVERIERILSADDMMGRKAFTPYADKAADFIAGEFKKAGLQTATGSAGFRQDFAIVTPKFVNASCTFDNENIDVKNVVVVTCQAGLLINEKS